jgi:hypothetical protein
LSDKDDTILLSDIVERREMKDKGSGRRIFNESMETRVTIRLDKKHIDIINEVMKQKDFTTISETIRYIIENSQK